MSETMPAQKAEATSEAPEPSLWAKTMRCCVCAWMMKVTNQDMLKAAAAGDCDMLKSCVDCGAWLDFVRPDDEAKNTALHLAVMHATDHADYLAEAERLGLKVDPDKKPDLESKLKPKSREAKNQLNADIKAWDEKHTNDLECIQALCEGQADPLLLNAEGQSALDLAKGPTGTKKDPQIIKALEDQVAVLEDLRKQAEEEEK